MRAQRAAGRVEVQHDLGFRGLPRLGYVGPGEIGAEIVAAFAGPPVIDPAPAAGRAFRAPRPRRLAHRLDAEHLAAQGTSAASAAGEQGGRLSRLFHAILSRFAKEERPRPARYHSLFRAQA